jgi:protein transport protein SEC61 subunit gamma and related proteins
MEEHEELGKEEETTTQESINPQQQRYQEHMEQRSQQKAHQQEKVTLIKKLRRFTNECKRVLKITKKPTGIEFKTIVKVSGVGMLLMGFIGFVITMINTLIVG